MSTAMPLELLPTEPAARSARTRACPALARGSEVARRYVIGEVGGYGAMGIVYAAWDQRLCRKVALKVLRTELASDTVVRERFANEARLAATLVNPHVVRVYDRGWLPSGEPFMVTEWLDGRSLAQILAARGRPAIRESVDLIIDACEGLAEAHARGIVHRDVKPENLVVCGEPGQKPVLKVVDFGISKRLSAAPTLTHEGDSLGSPCYMSPEQATESAYVDVRSDVWSLGVVLFELLTGRRPFDGGSIAEVFSAILSEPAPSLRAMRPELDRGLEAVVWRCLEKDPARRFKSADGLRQALLLFGSEGAHAAVLLGNAEQDDPLPPIPRRSSRALWLGAALAGAVVALAAWSVVGRDLHWSRVFEVPALGTTQEDPNPANAALTPRLDPVSGVYAAHAARDATARALRAEPERQTNPGITPPSGAADTSASDEVRGWVPLDDVSVKERRVFVNGRLVESESEIVDPNRPDEPSKQGEPDAQH